MNHTIRSIIISVFTLFACHLVAADVKHATVAVGGYDLTSYFESPKPVKGTGHFTETIDGVTYLFASKENKDKFAANPEKFLPQYGGYCAYGASVNKKFFADPQVYKVIKGKLYLNLDRKVFKIWNEDIAGNIEKADTNWKVIADKDPASL